MESTKQEPGSGHGAPLAKAQDQTTQQTRLPRGHACSAHAPTPIMTSCDCTVHETVSERRHGRQETDPRSRGVSVSRHILWPPCEHEHEHKQASSSRRPCVCRPADDDLPLPSDSPRSMRQTSWPGEQRRGESRREKPLTHTVTVAVSSLSRRRRVSPPVFFIATPSPAWSRCVAAPMRQLITVVVALALSPRFFTAGVRFSQCGHTDRLAFRSLPRRLAL